MLVASCLALALAQGERPSQDAPASKDETAATEAAIPWDAIEASMQSLIDSESIPGGVVGVIAGDRSEARGFGGLSFKDATKPDPDTLYEIGSITKVFTGILLADAVERGLVALDDPLQKRVPKGVSVPQGEPPISLLHLATHSSALPRLPRNFKPRDPQDPYADYGDEALWEGLSDSKLERAPGSRYEYSNFGFAVLGSVLVRLEDVPDYGSLLSQRILEPLHMDHTCILPDAEGQKKLAPGHLADLQPAIGWQFDAFAGAGAIRSTANDMLRFARANLDPDSTPLGKALRAAQESRFVDPETKTTLGLAWHYSTESKTLWHNGGTGGYHSFLAIAPERKIAVVVLANAAAAEVDSLAVHVRRLVEGQAKEPLKVEKPAAIEAAALDKLIGHYELSELEGIRVKREDSPARPAGLYVQLPRAFMRRVVARDALVFVGRGDPAFFVKFELDEKGERAEAIVVRIGDKERRAKRVGD